MSNVNVNRAIAMALAGNYKIGGDGEMMVQEVLWSGSLSNIGDEGTLSKTIDNYDLILIECNATPPDTTTVWNNIMLPSQNGVLTDINDNYGDSIYLYITFPNKNTVRLNHKLSKVFTNGAVTKIIGIKFTGTKSIDYSTEEQVIGKWIDGKPLYRKVFEVNKGSTEAIQLRNNVWTIITTCDTDLHFIRGDLFDNRQNSSSFPVQLYNNNGSIGIMCYRATNQGINPNSYLIVDYTKTTD